MIQFITRRNHDITDPRIEITSSLEDCESYITKHDSLGLDIEASSLNPFVAVILLISIGTEERQFVIDATSVPIDFLNKHKSKLFIGHNLKYDYTVLKRNGFEFRNMYDTMIVEQKIGAGTKRKNSLDAVLERRLNITVDKTTRNEFINAKHDFVFKDKHVLYSAEDVEHLFKIKEIQEKFISNLKLEFSLYNIEFPLIPILGDIELKGFDINVESWKEVLFKNILEAENLKKDMLRMLEISDKKHLIISNPIFKKGLKKKEQEEYKNKLIINFKSSDQIKELFKIYGVDIPTESKRNKNGEYETKETVGIKKIESLLLDEDFVLKPFIEKFIAYKKYEKLVSSFGEKFINMIEPTTGKIHTIYRQAATETGRFSSGDTANNRPNMQQIPKSKDYRHCIYYEDYQIVTCDLSSAEMVILGSLARDFKLIEYNKVDIHSPLAQAAWRKLLNDPTYVISKETNTDKRDKFKSVVYGLAYGATETKIAEVLNITVEEAKLVIETLKEEIPNTFKYLESVSNFGVEKGYVVFNTRTNSRRWFLDAYDAKKRNITLNKKAASVIERACKNSPIQGTNADMIKEAMVEITKKFKEKNLDAFILLQVHDELVVAFKNAPEVPEMVKTTMEEVANRYLEEGIQMKAEYKTLNTWTK
jgi:DNA polymerase I